MRCGLKGVLGFPASCEGSRCVFWREDARVSLPERPRGCVLDEFGLTGPVADRLARWLLAYKFSAERAHVDRQLRTHRARGPLRPAAPPARAASGAQNSSLCAVPSGSAGARSPRCS